MLRGVLLLVVLMAIGQVFPSCGGDENAQVVGWVEAKRVESSSHTFLIVINSADYQVPGYFYDQVQVGDLVKYDGRTWTIVKKASESPE
jgi:hypothetical protein